jgi:16S rRNA (guanine966-N2)-methyltransferase
MRIIAGRLRHRKLLSSPGNTTRPIIDRAKVMLFDRIRDRVPDARVADLFCGTGTLGFECLSRGAKSVVFIERDHKAYELLRQNVATLGVQAQALCWRVDLARCSMLPKGDRAWTPYDIVFFDPPYAGAKALEPGGDWHRCLMRLSRPTLTTEKVLLVLRTPREEPFSLPAPWETEYVIEIASMRITLAVKTGETGNVAELSPLDPDEDAEAVDSPEA